MAKRSTLAERVIAAAMTLSASQGWRQITLADIAATAKISPEQLFDLFPSKLAVLNGLNRRIDEQVIADGAPSGDSIRDNLFEMLMRRFEALTPNKEGIGAILRDTVSVDPMASFCGCRALCRSMAWSLEISGVSSSGMAGQIRTRVLAAAFVQAVRVWLGDDSEDMAKTMAALDRMLERMERAARACPGGRLREATEA